MRRLFPILLTLILESSLSMKTNSGLKNNSATCVSGFCLGGDYNSLELPSGNKEVTRITMHLEVLDVLRVDDKKFSVTLNMYFGVRWTENRLTKMTPGKSSWIPIDMDFMNYLWVPNVFVYNLVSFHALDCLKKLAGLWVAEGKDLFYNQATHVTFMCPMRFNKFPLDQHSCKFLVGSTNYDMTRMLFDYNTLSYDPLSGNTILDYRIQIKPLKTADRIINYGETGNYSLTGFEMTLTRNMAKYLYIYYLPSGLFVGVSWVSFLIPPDVVPGRMALLVTLFLVLINIFNTITNVSPNVEGMTAISSWMIACMFFVFGALLGYAAILYVLLMKKKNCLIKKRNDLAFVHAPSCYFYKVSEQTKRKEEIEELDHTEKLAKVDSILLYVFPFMFLVFNIIYWPFWIL
ncbi:glycine receptor subunit alpha-4 [Lepeophtheirus salmonis]|uniref:glycine receptor subunit alpha-4 n=1 Tax=Lepeophtheirus salmonis TaxID=72036 RepID=UPI001AE7FC60|nr:glycine receptor subunit alpha-4-like [Lepeophtheirus salmonis]